MQILFITHYKWPHVGGVEKHIKEVTRVLEKKGNKVKVVSEADIKYPKIKLFGLVYIWFWFLKNHRFIEHVDVVHIHDVFIWYLPFRLLYPNKKVVTTIHGLEWDNPLSKTSIWQKKLAINLSDRSVGVGDFLKKYLKIKFDLIIYGAAEKITSLHQDFGRRGNSIVYVGRLEENTGLLQFLRWLDKQKKKIKVDFVGDGKLRAACEKYGTVYGFSDPNPFYKKAKYCVPGGYLAALEALSHNCELKLFWNNKLKSDYWKMSPFVKKDVKVWAMAQTWDKIANEYLSLYHNAK